MLFLIVFVTISIVQPCSTKLIFIVSEYIPLTLNSFPMESSPEKGSESAANGFCAEFAQLKSNNRVQIKMLTMLADECRANGPPSITTVVRTIESQILKVLTLHACII